MENSFASLVDSSSSVLILLPVRPYFDQVAAALSLYLAIKPRKEAMISCPAPMLVEFNHLIGVDLIGQELGNKNLVIRFAGQKANDIDRVSSDIVGDELVLTVLPQPGVLAPKRDQVILGYSGVSADLVILIGGANETHFPALTNKDLAGAKLVHLGIRPLNIPQDRPLLSFARPASTISEAAAALLKENHFEFDPDSATNLVLGIEEGSGHFATPDVTPETFELFAHLLKCGGRRFSHTRPGEVPVSQAPRLTQQQVQQARDAQAQAQAQVQSAQAQPVGNTQPQEDIDTETIENKEIPQAQTPPADWLSQPKIYKGTSVS